MYIRELKMLQFKTDDVVMWTVMPSFIFAFRKRRANVILLN